MLNMAEHKNILVNILKDVFTNKDIGPFLGFKGGTAAYLFYDLDRASLDLDFDLLDEKQGDIVIEKMKIIISQYGKLKDAKKKRYSIFLLLSYREDSPNIKVEINLRDFGSEYEVKSYLGISMKVMVRQDMLAHKLVAMYERMGKANRDIFDVNFFLHKNWQINEKIIELRTELSIEKFLKKCIKLLEDLPDKGILSGMGELLDDKKKSWVKKNLRTDTIFQLRLLLDNGKKSSLTPTS